MYVISFCSFDNDAYAPLHLLLNALITWFISSGHFFEFLLPLVFGEQLQLLGHVRKSLAVFYSLQRFLTRCFPIPIHIILRKDLLDDLLILVLSQDLNLKNLLLLHKLLLVFLEMFRLNIVTILCDHLWNMPTLVLLSSQLVDRFTSCFLEEMCFILFLEPGINLYFLLLLSTRELSRNSCFGPKVV